MQNQFKSADAALHAAQPIPHALGKDKRQTAQYIADMALEMRNLAKGQGLISLQGLLEVAYYEAFTAATENQIPEGELERLQTMGKASLG